MSNYYEDVNGNEQLRPMERAEFENCIIYGKIESEIGIEELRIRLLITIQQLLN